MLKKFAGVLSDVPGDSNVKELSLTVRPGKIVSLPPYKVPEGLREGVRKEMEKLLSQGIIEESTSHWSSPVESVLNSL